MGILGIISPGMTDSFTCSLINGELLLGARCWFSSASGLNGKRFWDGLVMAARKRKQGWWRDVSQLSFLIYPTSKAQ